MHLPSRELTPDDLELIEFARQIVDAGSDGEQGVPTMGAAVREADGQILFDYHPGIRVILPTGQGVRSVRIQDLMPLGAVWTVDGGTQQFDPALFANRPDSDWAQPAALRRGLMLPRARGGTRGIRGSPGRDLIQDPR
jgi:hypothetical protein